MTRSLHEMVAAHRLARARLAEPGVGDDLSAQIEKELSAELEPGGDLSLELGGRQREAGAIEGTVER